MEKNKTGNTAGAAASALWGSDLIAGMMRKLGFPYVALNPGSSFRGLHDSLVNHLGNSDPEMLLCLHEEHAVSLAHGWAKITGEPMAVILHANVGLMHGSMAIYNAWCDRVPMVIFGATGPVDAEQRRPWIDWIHTSRDQAALVRPFIKWDDQPASIAAAQESMIRAKTVSCTPPCAPTYVCFDVSLQEARAEPVDAVYDPGAHAMPREATPADTDIAALLDALENAANPVFLMGRVSRSESDWGLRVALAEHFKAKVLTDIKTAAAFPTDHPCHAAPPSFFLSAHAKKILSEADLIIAFDWIDPAGTLKEAGTKGRVINISMDHLLANGWSCDTMAGPPCDMHLAVSPDSVVRYLAERLEPDPASPGATLPEIPDISELPESPISMQIFADALAAGLSGQAVTFVRLPLGWDGAAWDFRHPLDYLGYDGGAGIGSGPGMLIGAALAIRDMNIPRIPVGVLGDGDVMMGVSAFWTAAHYAIPLIAIVCNNQSYFNDEIHQEKIARTRGRPIENKSVGQAIKNPDIDFAAMAKAQGLCAIGPVHTGRELADAITEAVELFRQGKPVLIDARVKPEYASDMSENMTATPSG